MGHHCSDHCAHSPPRWSHHHHRSLHCHPCSHHRSRSPSPSESLLSHHHPLTIVAGLGIGVAALLANKAWSKLLSPTSSSPKRDPSPAHQPRRDHHHHLRQPSERQDRGRPRRRRSDLDYSADNEVEEDRYRRAARHRGDSALRDRRQWRSEEREHARSQMGHRSRDSEQTNRDRRPRRTRPRDDKPLMSGANGGVDTDDEVRGVYDEGSRRQRNSSWDAEDLIIVEEERPRRSRRRSERYP